MNIIAYVFQMALSLSGALPPAQTAIDEFVFNNNAEVESIDPHLATGVPDNTIIVQMFEGLMARKSDWVTVIPGLAEKVITSKDGKTFTFKLRPNLKWSDGSALTAKDFEYSWYRIINPKTLSQYAYWLTDNVDGAKAYFENPTDANLKKVGIKATNDLTFEVRLNKPLSYFLQLAAEQVLVPVKKEIVEKFGDQWTRPENIVVNGPYKLTEWKVQDKMVLVKNPYYYGAKDIKLNRVVALALSDRQTAVNLFKQGKLDWSGTNGAPNTLVPSYRSDPTFRVNPGFVTYYYWLNTNKKPLNDKRVRQALSLAIDRKQIVEKITRGGESPANSFVPSNTGSYISPAALFTNDYEKDLKKAKELLAQAGFPDGKNFPTLELQYNTDDNHKRLAQTVAQMWKKNLGINVSIYNLEWKVYLQQQRAKNFDLSRAGWSGDYPDPVTFLELLLKGSGNNHSGWTSDVYDSLLEKANSTRNAKARLDLLKKAEAMILDETPLIPVYFYVHYGFIRPEVVGFQANLADRPFIRFYDKKSADSVKNLESSTK